MNEVEWLRSHFAGPILIYGENGISSADRRDALLLNVEVAARQAELQSWISVRVSMRHRVSVRPRAEGETGPPPTVTHSD